MATNYKEELLKKLEILKRENEQLEVDNKRLTNELSQLRIEREEKQQLNKNTDNIESLKAKIKQTVETLRRKGEETIKSEMAQPTQTIEDAPPPPPPPPPMPTSTKEDEKNENNLNSPKTHTTTLESKQDLGEQLRSPISLKKVDATKKEKAPIFNPSDNKQPTSMPDILFNKMKNLTIPLEEEPEESNDSDWGEESTPTSKFVEPEKTVKKTEINEQEILLLQKQIEAIQKRVAKYKEINKNQVGIIEKMKKDVEKLPQLPQEYSTLGYTVYRQDQTNLIKVLNTKLEELKKLDSEYDKITSIIETAEKDLQKEPPEIVEPAPKSISESLSKLTFEESVNLDNVETSIPLPPPPPPPPPAENVLKPQISKLVVSDKKSNTMEHTSLSLTNKPEESQQKLVISPELLKKTKKPSSEKDEILKILRDPTHKHHAALMDALGEQDANHLNKIMVETIEKMQVSIQKQNVLERDLIKTLTQRRGSIKPKQKKNAIFKQNELNSPEVINAIENFYNNLLKLNPEKEKEIRNAYVKTQVEKPSETIETKKATTPKAEEKTVIEGPGLPLQIEKTFLDTITNDLEMGRKKLEMQEKRATELVQKAEEHLKGLTPIAAKQEKQPSIAQPKTTNKPSQAETIVSQTNIEETKVENISSQLTAQQTTELKDALGNIIKTQEEVPPPLPSRLDIDVPPQLPRNNVDKVVPPPLPRTKAEIVPPQPPRPGEKPALPPRDVPPPLPTRSLTTQQEREKFAAQFIETALFKTLQPKFFEAITPLGEKLINTANVHHGTSLNDQQYIELNAIGINLARELPSHTPTKPSELKKAFSVFIANLQKLRDFCNNNPAISGKMSADVLSSMETFKNFITLGRNTASQPDISEKLSRGLNKRFDMIEIHIKSITNILETNIKQTADKTNKQQVTTTTSLNDASDQQEALKKQEEKNRNATIEKVNQGRKKGAF